MHVRLARPPETEVRPRAPLLQDVDGAPGVRLGLGEAVEAVLGHGHVERAIADAGGLGSTLLVRAHGGLGVGELRLRLAAPELGERAEGEEPRSVVEGERGRHEGLGAGVDLVGLGEAELVAHVERDPAEDDAGLRGVLSLQALLDLEEAAERRLGLGVVRLPVLRLAQTVQRHVGAHVLDADEAPGGAHHGLRAPDGRGERRRARLVETALALERLHRHLEEREVGRERLEPVAHGPCRDHDGHDEHLPAAVQSLALAERRGGAAGQGARLDRAAGQAGLEALLETAVREQALGRELRPRAEAPDVAARLGPALAEQAEAVRAALAPDEAQPTVLARLVLAEHHLVAHVLEWLGLGGARGRAGPRQCGGGQQDRGCLPDHEFPPRRLLHCRAGAAPLVASHCASSKASAACAPRPVRS